MSSPYLETEQRRGRELKRLLKRKLAKARRIVQEGRESGII